MIINKLDFHIDSKLKENNSLDNSNFLYTLDIPTNLINQLTHISVTQFTCPKSSYCVEANDNRNIFQIYMNGQYINISLDEGNYSNTDIYGDKYDIKKQLKTKLDLATGYVWTITKYLFPNVETGKLYYVCSDNSPKQFIFNTYKNNISDIMGFSELNNISFNDTLISTSVINLNKNNVIYLVSDLCINYNRDLSVTQGNSILSTLYVSQNRLLSYVTQEYDMIYNMKVFNNNKNNVYNFKLFNEDGLPLVLNNVAIQISISIFTYIPIEKIIKKINDYIDYKIISQ